MKIDGGLMTTDLRDAARLAAHAEQLGYDGLWTAEAGHDLVHGLLGHRQHGLWRDAVGEGVLDPVRAFAVVPGDRLHVFAGVEELVLLVAAPLSHPGTIGARDVGLMAALGIGQIGLGLVFFTIGGRLIPAAEVALITLLEVVLGPLWVWLFLSEQPGAATLVGGAIVLGAVAIQTASTAEEPQPLSGP